MGMLEDLMEFIYSRRATELERQEDRKSGEHAIPAPDYMSLGKPINEWQGRGGDKIIEAFKNAYYDGGSSEPPAPEPQAGLPPQGPPSTPPPMMPSHGQDQFNDSGAITMEDIAALVKQKTEQQTPDVDYPTDPRFSGQYPGISVGDLQKQASTGETGQSKLERIIQQSGGIPGAGSFSGGDPNAPQGKGVTIGGQPSDQWHEQEMKKNMVEDAFRQGMLQMTQQGGDPVKGKAILEAAVGYLSSQGDVAYADAIFGTRAQAQEPMERAIVSSIVKAGENADKNILELESNYDITDEQRKSRIDFHMKAKEIYVMLLSQRITPDKAGRQFEALVSGANAGPGGASAPLVGGGESQTRRYDKEGNRIQ